MISALSLAACGDDGTATNTTESGGSTTDMATGTTGPGTTDVVPTTTDATATEGSNDTTMVDTTGPDSFCGDGVVDPGEACDDGAANGPGQACNAACQANACGDGDLGPGEQCDDGAGNGDMNSCKSDCTHAQCGDGLVGPGEGCDDGNAVDDDECTNACALASCGDGVVAPTEACDDGNKSNTALAKHPRATAPSLPGPIRCLAGVPRAPPEPDRARFVMATTPMGAFLATRRQRASRV